jgi:hypothetical protein
MRRGRPILSAEQDRQAVDRVSHARCRVQEVSRSAHPESVAAAARGCRRDHTPIREAILSIEHQRTRWLFSAVVLDMIFEPSSVHRESSSRPLLLDPAFDHPDAETCTWVSGPLAWYASVTW